jgi:DNA-binding response OmpR family regulator
MNAGKSLFDFPIHLGLGAKAVSEPEFTGPEWYDGYMERHGDDLDEGRLVIDVGRAEVWVRGQRIDLSATEYRLLVFLARRPDRVISPTEILTHVWGQEYVNELGYVKSYVRLVRRKIEEDPRMPRYLVSRRGLGYTLVGSPGADNGPSEP